MLISPHLSLAEATHSDTALRKGIDNTPPQAIINKLCTTASHIFEPARNHFGVPIIVSSGYRSPALNKAIGGEPTSQHCKGEALDMVMTQGRTNKELFEWLLNNVEFDQLIAEDNLKGQPKWIHCSYTTTKPNRKEVWVAKRNLLGKMTYVKYTPNVWKSIYG